jgi:hypothetical protein
MTPLSEPLVADGVDTSEHVPFSVPERILVLQIFNGVKYNYGESSHVHEQC